MVQCYMCKKEVSLMWHREQGYPICKECAEKMTPTKNGNGQLKPGCPHCGILGVPHVF